MPTYTIKGPDGTTLDITGDKPPSADVVKAAFAHAGKSSPVGDNPGTYMQANRGWHSPQVTSDEPDLGRDVARMGSGMAHPQGIGDFLSLLIPAEVPHLGEFASRSAGAFKAAAQDTPGTVKGILSYPNRAYSKFRDALPSKMDQAIADFHGGATPPVNAPAATVSTGAAPDALDRALAAARQNRRPPVAPTLRKGAEAPTVTNALQEALDAARGGNPAKGTTAPAPTITSAGREGAFASSGRPAVTQARQAEIEAQAAGARGAQTPRTPPPATKGAKLADTSSGSDQLGELLDAIHGPNAPSVGNGTLPNGGGQPSMEEAVADQIRQMRRKYGAGRLGKAVSPSAPEAGNGYISRADPSQAGSAMPDIAQEAVLRDLKANTSADPAKVIRAVRQLVTEYGRNKGPANSPVARELHDLLKGAGFVKD